MRAPHAGADRRMPNASRTDLEHLLREHRKQRDGATEEHREQVERDRTEQHGCPADERDPREHALEVG